MLETYPQENMNTQAIRELITELDRLKGKDNQIDSTISAIQSRIGDIPIITIKDELINFPTTIPAGSANGGGVPSPTHNGKRPQIIIPHRIILNTDASTNQLVCNNLQFSTYGDPPYPTISWFFRNLSDTDLTIKQVSCFTVYVD